MYITICNVDPLTRTDSSVQIKVVGVGVLLPPFDWRVPEQTP